MHEVDEFFLRGKRYRKELIRGREGGEGIKIFIMREADEFFSRGKRCGHRHRKLIGEREGGEGIKLFIMHEVDEFFFKEVREIEKMESIIEKDFIF